MLSNIMNFQRAIYAICETLYSKRGASMFGNDGRGIMIIKIGEYTVKYTDRYSICIYNGYHREYIDIFGAGGFDNFHKDQRLEILYALDKY